MKTIRKLIIVSIVVMMLFGLSISDDRRTDRSVLVIMTLNAEFLWDGVEPEEGQVNFPWKGSPTEAEEHMRKVAEIIIRSNPDIVNLVEVENKQALDNLNDNFLVGRGYKVYFVQGRDSYTGQDVVLLTSIDPDNGRIERDDREGRSGNIRKSVSKNYYAKIEVGNEKIALISLHFLSRPPDESRINKRQAQADAIRTLAMDLDDDYSIVVLGDFNDYDGEDSNRDHIDSRPVTNVLKMIKEMDASDPDDDLINVASFVQKSTRYTAFYDANRNGMVNPPQEFTSIDHILLSSELAAEVESVEIPHYHDPMNVTDHFPVVVRLRGLDSVQPPAFNVRIVSLLPNPSGNENQNEEVTIKNLGSQSVNLNGWKLRDLAGKTWSLDELSTLNPGEEKTVKRNGKKMALNNNGDTIDLIDSSGNVVHTVTYTRAEEGEVIMPIIN